MYINIPAGTCNGRYYIVSVTDPDNNFLEISETNNHIAVPITLIRQTDCTAGNIRTMSGTVTDLVTGNPISGATVQIVGTGVDQSATSGVDGSYLFEVDRGVYTVSVSKIGYVSISRSINLVGSLYSPSEADFALVIRPNPGEFTASLLWGASPPDLDFHLMAPTGCYLNYQSRACDLGQAHLQLSNDVSSGFGPETITMTGPLPCGRYELWAAVYGSSSSFAGSDARVEIFNQYGVMAIRNVPASKAAGPAWRVARIDIPVTGAPSIQFPDEVLQNEPAHFPDDPCTQTSLCPNLEATCILQCGSLTEVERCVCEAGEASVTCLGNGQQTETETDPSQAGTSDEESSDANTVAVGVTLSIMTLVTLLQ